MNIERMTALRNALAEGEAFDGHLSFNMSTFIDDVGLNYVGDAKEYLKSCETSGCLAGWTCLLFGPVDDRISSDTAAALLDLDLGQSERLFFNRDGYVAKDAWTLNDRFDGKHNRCLKQITVEEGVAALDRMIHEGEVYEALRKAYSFKADTESLYKALED